MVFVVLIISSALVIAFWDSPTGIKWDKTLLNKKIENTEIIAPASLASEKQKTQSAKQTKESVPKPKAEAGENKIENTMPVTVLAGDVTVHLAVTPDTVFYDALVQAENTGKITFSGKNYPGLGFFVTDFGGLHAGNGKNLLYYINGKEATVGVSSYILKGDDIIEWKLK
ncbi:MAG: DUF4430 domain-containing protein [Candidatus Paceibacterota bacterium]